MGKGKIFIRPCLNIGAVLLKRGMQDMVKDDFIDAGIDYDKDLEIFMGNQKLYNQFLKKFLYNGSYEELCMGLEMGDFAMAEKAACTLKGIAGNLGMVDLSGILEKMILALWKNKTDDALLLHKELKQSYENISALLQTM